MTTEQTDPPEVAAEDDPRLADLARFTSELEAAELDVKGWREMRNKEILRLRQLDDAPGIEAIALVAKIRHSFVSRIVKGAGRPASGHTNDD